MISNLQLSQKGYILVAVPLLFQLLFVAVLGFFLNRAELESKSLAHSQAVIGTASQCRQRVFQTGMSVFVSYMSRSEESYARVERLVEDSDRLQRQLGELVKNDPAERAIFEQLDKDWRKSLRPTILKIAGGVKDNAQMSSLIGVMELRRLIEKSAVKSSGLLDRLEETERAKGITPAKEKHYRELVKYALWAAVLFNIVLAVGLAAYFNRDAGRRLNVLLTNALRLSAEEKLLPELNGNDEIARIDAMFHRMADELSVLSHRERAIVENAADVILTLDSDFKFLRVNPAVLPAWGYAPGDLLGQRLINLVHAEDKERTIAYLDQLRKGPGKEQLENRIKTRDAGYVYTLWSAQWSAPENAYFCVAHDINERREIERMKQEFVAMITHDLRTPLSSIQATLGLLDQGLYGDLTENGRKRVSGAEKSCDNLISLITDLLDIEKMQSGRFELIYGKTDVSELINKAVDSVAGFAGRSGIELKAAVSDCAINVDERRIVQVVVNLLSNAIKFSEPGGIVEVSAERLDDALRIAVRDKGRGIPAAHLDSIFERFSQVKASDATEKRGTGLGLAISKSIVEAHGGAIGAISEEGKGSEFWLTVPLTSQQDGDTARKGLANV